MYVHTHINTLYMFVLIILSINMHQFIGSTNLWLRQHKSAYHARPGFPNLIEVTSVHHGEFDTAIGMLISKDM